MVRSMRTVPFLFHLVVGPFAASSPTGFSFSWPRHCALRLDFDRFTCLHHANDDVDAHFIDIHF